MKTNDALSPSRTLATSRINDLVHAIALAMARRQMLQAWPRL
jgi:hypothetical protein